MKKGLLLKNSTYFFVSGIYNNGMLNKIEITTFCRFDINTKITNMDTRIFGAFIILLVWIFFPNEIQHDLRGQTVVILYLLTMIEIADW